MVRMRGAMLVSIMLLGVTTAAGCFGPGDCSGGQGFMAGGSGQSGVCNATNKFVWGAQGGPFTKTESFDWENTKGKAEIAWGSQGSGSVKVTLKDADGTTVYSDSWSGSGQSGATDTSDSGATGTWTITLRMVAAQGQLGVTIRAI